MIVVKIYESKPLDSGSGLDSLIASAIPKLIETYSFKNEDRDAIQDLFVAYEPEKYMIVVKYNDPSELGRKWLEFSTMYGTVSNPSSILEYIVGQA
jgi:hypothetical protein